MSSEMTTDLPKSLPNWEMQTQTYNNRKLQVWLRLRPLPPCEESFMTVGQDGKAVRVTVKPEDRIVHNKRTSSSCKPDGKTEFINFTADGILNNSSQEETFRLIADDLVVQAMNGISGVIVCLGPENGGKSFTLFGRAGKYQYRGLIPRSLGKIFEIIASRHDEFAYAIRLAVTEIHHNRIRDLLTVAGNPVSGQQPAPNHSAFHFENVESVESGLVLLMLGLAAQKNTKREPISQFHTIVYLDIYGQPLDTDGNKTKGHHSRITFAKIASIPKHSNELDSTSGSTSGNEFGNCSNSNSRNCTRSSRCSVSRSSLNPKRSSSVSPRKTTSSTLCNFLHLPRGPISPITEAIEVRKDLFLLEQMFEGAIEVRKLIASPKSRHSPQKSKLSTSQYFRQCKLALCLQDIMPSTSEVRIVLNIRPELQYLQRSLEAIKFALKAESIPQEAGAFNNMDAPFEHSAATINPTIIQEELAQIHKDLKLMEQNNGGEIAAVITPGDNPGSPTTMPPVAAKKPLMVDLLHKEALSTSWNPNRLLLLQISAFLEGKLGAIDVESRSQVKMVLEIIRQMWQYTSENVWQNKESLSVKQSAHQMTQAPEGETKPRKKRSKVPVSSSPSSITQGPTNKGSKPSKKGKSRRPSQGHVSDTPSVGDVGPIVSEAQVDKQHGISDEINNNVAVSPPIENSTAEHPQQKHCPSHEAHEIWKKFVQTPEGQAVVTEFNRQRTILHDSLQAMNGILQPTASTLSNSIHKFVTLIIQDSHLKANENEKGGKEIQNGAGASEHPVFDELKFLNTNCDEFIQKMVDLCAQALEHQSQIVEKCRTDCEDVFLTYAKDNPDVLKLTEAEGEESNPVSIIPEEFQNPTHGTLNQEVSSSLIACFQEGESTSESLLAKHYAEISRHARKHAKQLLKFYNVKEPWDNSFTKTSC